MTTTEARTDLKMVEAQFEKTKLILEGVQAAHSLEIEHLTETIARLEELLKFAKRRKNELENSLSKNSGLTEDTKVEFTGDSHSKSEMQGKRLSEPQEFTVKGKRIRLNAQQVEELKSIYKADKKLNPKAGPNGAVKKVLVKTGIIPPHHANNAWNAVARIVGHLTPAQKRAIKAAKNF